VISVKYLAGMISSVLMSLRSRKRTGPPKVFICALLTEKDKIIVATEITEDSE